MSWQYYENSCDTVKYQKGPVKPYLYFFLSRGRGRDGGKDSSEGSGQGSGTCWARDWTLAGTKAGEGLAGQACLFA